MNHNARIGKRGKELGFVYDGDKLQSPKPRKGVGDWTHWLIRRIAFETYTSNCRCRSMIYRMNTWGPWGCIRHLPEISASMANEAVTRGYRLAKYKGPTIIACAFFVLLAVPITIVDTLIEHKGTLQKES